MAAAAHACVASGRSTHLVAAVFVQQHQHQSHDDDDGDHDGGVQDGVKSSLRHRVCVLGERGVDPGTHTQ